MKSNSNKEVKQISKTRKYLTVGGAILAISAGGAGAALATGSGDDGGKNGPTGPRREAEEPAVNDSNAVVKGPGADEATAAALKITGGGQANSVEKDSENGATWEVEVTKPDGSTVDVRLDQNDQLVVVEDDSGN